MPIYLSQGNKKLKSNEKTAFIIWNIPSHVTCPYRTSLCEKYCYAKRAERLYKGVLESRFNNYNESLKATFISDMISEITTMRAKKAYQGKQTIVRIHESGDFYNPQYVIKWIEIVKALPDVIFIAYTKSLEYFRKLTIPENLVIRASIWNDSTVEFRELVKAGKYPTFTTQDNIADGEKTEICKCSDCANCGKCWNKSIKNIVIKKH